MAARRAHRVFRVAPLFLLMTLLPISAEPRPVRVGVFPAAPLVFVREGRPDGLFIDLIRHFSRALDWDVEYVEDTWSELLVSLERGTIDLLPAVGHTSQRTAVYDFSRNPVFIDSGVLFASPRLVLHTVFDLEGKRIAAVRGSIFTTGFTELVASFGISCDMLLTDDNRSVMKAIDRGAADAGVCIYSLGNELAREFHIPITPISFSPVALEFAVPKGRNADILAGIDRLMAGMVDDPDSVYSRSYQKWTSPPAQWTMPAWLRWGTAGLLCLGLFLAAWNTTLKRQVVQKTKHLSVEIADRKRASEELAAEKERIAVALRSIGDGVITTDGRGSIVIMNNKAEALCGWPQHEAEGKALTSVFTILDEDSREPLGNPVDEVMGAGRIVELPDPAVLVSRDGTERLVAGSAAPIMDANGVTMGAVLAFHDVTERRRMLEAIQRTDKLESLGMLAGGIAHDFNNLLAGLFGYVSLARNSADAKTQGYLEKALSVFGRAKNLAEQLLTFSAGGSPRRRIGRIGRLLGETVSFAVSGSSVHCDLAIAEDLWASSHDENQMSQVFDNLVLNARQAMSGGGTIRVAAENTVLREGEIPALTAGPYVQITIADTGPGIPLELQKRIFDPFFTTKRDGHGLGLATCYSIMRRHNGSISFVSEPGAGTTFRLLLPASTEETDRERPSPATSHEGTGAILVMDDEDFIRDIVSVMLNDMGYTVITARNGEEALAGCEDLMGRGESLRAAILDLTVRRGMGGKDTVRAMRERCPGLPIFASSGYSDDPVMSAPQQYGFSDSISKPYRMHDLADLLRRNGL
jgi:PAS domain S-box-containing protein